MDLTPNDKKISKITAIAKNLSDSKSYLVCDVFKHHIHDIRKANGGLKSESFNKTLFNNAFNSHNNNTNSVLNSLSHIGVNTSDGESNQRLSVESAAKQLLTKRPTHEDKCCQTDANEFAKIKVLGQSGESSDDFIEYSENFIKELEFRNMATNMINNYHLKHPESDDKDSENLNDKQIFLSLNCETTPEDDDEDNGNQRKSDQMMNELLLSQTKTSNLGADRQTKTIRSSNDVKQVMKRLSLTNTGGGSGLGGRVMSLESLSSCLSLSSSSHGSVATPRLIFDSQIVEHKPEKCGNYEVAEDAYHIQHFQDDEDDYYYLSSPTIDSIKDKSIKFIQSVHNHVKWSDLIQLLKTKTKH